VRLWRNPGSWFDLGLRQQITRAGLLYSVVCALVALAAFASANNLLFLILAAMLSTLLISGFVSRLSLAGLELDFVLPEHVPANRRLEGRVVIRNVKRWMPSFSIHLTPTDANSVSKPLYFLVIPGRSAADGPVEVFFPRRGRYRETSFRFSTRFPFGFSERRIHVRMARDLIVYPSIDPQPGFEELIASIAGELEAHARGPGHDFHRIRPYEALESARHVDWKATAHTGDLQVREFAREQELAVEMWLDLDVPEDAHEWFERAICMCAFLAWRLTERGARFRLCTQEFDARVPEEADVYNILKYLALVTPAHGRTLPPPDNASAYRIVFSASPERLAAAGQEMAGSRVRLAGPDGFGGPGADSAGAADNAGAAADGDPAGPDVNRRH
jgi:uncharacterized protein (DUF58 family)